MYRSANVFSVSCFEAVYDGTAVIKERGKPVPPDRPSRSPRTGKPLSPQPHASSAACPDRALPRYALLRAAVAGHRWALGPPPAPRARGGRWRRRAAGRAGRKGRSFFPRNLKPLSRHTSPVRGRLSRPSRSEIAPDGSRVMSVRRLCDLVQGHRVAQALKSLERPLAFPLLLAWYQAIVPLLLIKRPL